MVRSPFAFSFALGLGVLLASCLSTEGYHRNADGGGSGRAGSSGGTPSPDGGGPTGAAGQGPTGAAGQGPTGAAGTTGAAGSGITGAAGQSPTGAAGVTGAAGTGVGTAGRGGAGSTGTAGRGGTGGTPTGAGGGRGGSSGGGSGAVLFSDDFETGSDGWNFAGAGTHMVTADGSNQVFSLGETTGDQHLGAAGMLTWTDQIVEARVKVTGFNGSSSSDVAAICARLIDPEHFYYFAIQSDGKAKIKINDGGNSSLGSSIEFGYAPNTWYTMRLSVVGSTLTAFINGQMVGQVTDTSLTSGAVGLMVQRTSAVFDDVVVRAP